MKRSIQNAEHYQWGDNCDGWHLLKNDSLSVIQERMPAGTFEMRHFHQRSQQLFYVLSGTAKFELEGEVFLLNPGESIHVEKGKKHCITNPGIEDLGFMVISEPKAHGDRVEV
jgi:mannose-6-phosphate isomerase-like protein (cupin superfamily)